MKKVLVGIFFGSWISVAFGSVTVINHTLDDMEIKYLGKVVTLAGYDTYDLDIDEYCEIEVDEIPYDVSPDSIIAFVQDNRGVLLVQKCLKDQLHVLEAIIDGDSY